MKPINILQKSKAWIHTNFLRNIRYSQTKLLISISILLVIATTIWLGGQYLAGGNDALYIQPEKRIYIILLICLIWLGKFIVFDMNKPTPVALYDPPTKYKLQALENRFNGALQFLNKTTIKKDAKLLRLNQLPWCLLIGPENAGKTTLLASADVNFTLQRQFPNQDLQHLDPSEHCDWWVTRDISIIDVPGKYLSLPDISKNKKKLDHSIIWKSFLQLIKAHRGKHSISSIAIALPLPDLIKSNEQNQILQRYIFQSIHHLQKIFQHPIPCHIIITKCDLLPGFTEFFVELGNDETTQAWGISLPHQQNNHKIHEAFSIRFDALIKRLNQQLLFRLHHERNPFLRVQIKDFPLHVEQLKENLIDFIKKFSAIYPILPVQHVCLTSAIQRSREEKPSILDEVNYSSQKQIQVFKEPPSTSRAYFIKQLITHNIINTSIPHTPNNKSILWKKHVTYATSLGLAGLITLLLIKDFRQSIAQTYYAQNLLTTYQFNIKQTHDTDTRLEITATLLNRLQKSIKPTTLQYNIVHFLTFYSHKSQEKMEKIYYKVLQTYLLANIKEYLEEYLKLPINQDPKYVFAALKCYLMLGDASRFQAPFIIDTMRQIMPKSMAELDREQLLQHITLALKHVWKPISLDQNTIFKSRKYLSSIPNMRLAYIILKNFNSNEKSYEINLAKNNESIPVFANQTLITQIPIMFTAKAFTDIYSKEITTAINEITTGNWVLSNNNSNQTMLLNTKLADQLRAIYVSNYAKAWENTLTTIHLSTPKSLAEVDIQIVNMISDHSPLLQLLQALSKNTNFEPIILSSQKLRNINSLIEKNNPTGSNIYQIFYGLQSLHQYLYPILNSHHVKKSAFELISNRLKKLGTPEDPILQLRSIASKNPDPIKTWLDHISNNAWYFLVQEASHYLDMTWQNRVIPYYQMDIANRYPFNVATDQEVVLNKFISFFGYSGIIKNFYTQYLQFFIDTSTPDWQWKLIGNQKLPFSIESLRQIQQAMLIQETFFPNRDNKPYLHFTIQPYKFGNQIKSVKLNINNKEIVDTPNNLTDIHTLIWPATHLQPDNIIIQITMANSKIVNQHFPGDWGWFKLVNQSFENVITRKQMLLNFSIKEQPAKYILYVQNQYNPFLAFNLSHFNLPTQLIEQKG